MLKKKKKIMRRIIYIHIWNLNHSIHDLCCAVFVLYAPYLSIDVYLVGRLIYHNYFVRSRLYILSPNSVFRLFVLFVFVDDGLLFWPGDIYI